MKKLLVLVCFISFKANSQSNQFRDYLNTLGNDSLTKFVSHWIGSPYKFGGDDENGIDCSQFNKKLYKEVYELELSNTCYSQWKQTYRVTKENLQVGDLVFFGSRASPSGWHCGVYIGENNFVHASGEKYGVRLSTLDDSKYKLKFKSGGRL